MVSDDVIGQCKHGGRVLAAGALGGCPHCDSERFTAFLENATRVVGSWPAWKQGDLLTITAERDALRARVAELEQRLADLSRMVVAAEVEDDA